MKYVLIVEDDQYIADAYRLKFSHLKSFKFDIAHDGNEALEKIRAKKPNAMILDLLMPGLDGLGLLKILRDEKIHIPTLVASNVDSDSTIKQAIDLGAKDYFV